ncbi:unnamed protein product [Spirodela intermedia]|uniref:Uncharacterized protein n=2 Tax=Spirodela intermedia TaxID=51605 RepID=A0A7I8JJK3_SPIIN|nr:unnamed protein product [Spirodela intermedia]CAA6670309.1 unnamed protein product [Spirodela intermedia]CAA7407367.1 unnamed protein product [Spirodela intermedia]
MAMSWKALMKLGDWIFLVSSVLSVSCPVFSQGLHFGIDAQDLGWFSEAS